MFDNTESNEISMRRRPTDAITLPMTVSLSLCPLCSLSCLPKYRDRALGQFPVRLDKMESAEITWQVENGQQLPFCCLLIVSFRSLFLSLSFLSAFSLSPLACTRCPFLFLALIGRHQLRPLLPACHFKFIIDLLSIAHTNTQSCAASAQCTLLSCSYSPDPSFNSASFSLCLRFCLS